MFIPSENKYIFSFDHQASRLYSDSRIQSRDFVIITEEEDDKPPYYFMSSPHLNSLNSPEEVWMRGLALLALYNGACNLLYNPMNEYNSISSLKLQRLFVTIAIWINDPDGDENTLNSNVLQRVWDGLSWGPVLYAVTNSGNNVIKDIGLDFNDNYCVETVAWSSYQDTTDVIEVLDIWVFENTGTIQKVDSLQITDLTSYFQKPNVSISENNIVSVTYQKLPLYDTDTINPNQGTVQMRFKDLDVTSPWYSSASSLLGNGSNNFVYDMDAGFGDGNHFYTLEHETSTSGDVTTPYPSGNSKFCGDSSISLILRGVIVNSSTLSPLSFNSPTGIEHIEQNTLFTHGFELMQNYPNPFNGSTTIEFILPEKCSASMDLFDMHGRKVAAIFNQEFEKGKYMTDFSSGTLPSGFYYYRLTVNNSKSLTKKLMIIQN